MTPEEFKLALDDYRQSVVSQLNASRYGTLAESFAVQEAWRVEKAACETVLRIYADLRSQLQAEQERREEAERECNLQRQMVAQSIVPFSAFMRVLLFSQSKKCGIVQNESVLRREFVSSLLGGPVSGAQV